MRRRDFLLGTAAVSIAGAREGGPGIVLVVAPTWRAQALPSESHAAVDAPNLARLAKEGAIFERCYAANPERAPSLASLFTGMWPHAVNVPRNGAALPTGLPALAPMRSGAGNSTRFLGDRSRGQSGRDHRLHEAGDAAAAGPAVEFLRANKARPFLVCWSPPMAASGPGADAERLEAPPNVPSARGAEARAGMAGHYARYAAIDRGLGQLLRALDEEGIANQTLVLFTSDHGGMMGSQGLEGAGQPFEESARTPLVIRYPPLPRAGTRRDMLLSNADLAPTLLGLAGVEVPPEMQGRDLGNAVFRDGEPPDSVYCQGRLGQPDEWRMVVRGLEKLVVNAKGEPVYHFNLGQDPHEQLNRIEESALKRNRDELRARLRHWAGRLGDRTDGSGFRRR